MMIGFSVFSNLPVSKSGLAPPTPRTPIPLIVGTKVIPNLKQ